MEVLEEGFCYLTLWRYGDCATIRFSRSIDMNEDQKEGIKDQVKGWTNTVIGSVTGDEDRKVKGTYKSQTGQTKRITGIRRTMLRKAQMTPVTLRMNECQAR
jgi:uncharacterized protein YjbJ (UPF0337 family)